MRVNLNGLAFALAIGALAIMPVACASGGGTVQPGGVRTISSGGPASTGGGGGGGTTTTPVTTAPGGGGGGGGGGVKAPAPGFMPFSSGCGQMDSVSSSSTSALGQPNVITIATKTSEHNCENIIWEIDYVNMSTGLLEDSEQCFNFTLTQYTCNSKFKTAQAGTTYQTIVTVWQATPVNNQFAIPTNPAYILGTETLTTTTAGAAVNSNA